MLKFVQAFSAWCQPTAASGFSHSWWVGGRFCEPHSPTHRFAVEEPAWCFSACRRLGLRAFSEAAEALLWKCREVWAPIRNPPPKADGSQWASGLAEGQLTSPAWDRRSGGIPCAPRYLRESGLLPVAATSLPFSGVTFPVSTSLSLLLGSLSPRQAQTHLCLRLCIQGAPQRQMPSLWGDGKD